MTPNQKFSLDDQQYFNTSRDEIDLKQILETLIRNKKIIGISGLTGLILSSFIAFTTQKTWQCEFQIVLETNSISAGLSGTPLSRIAAFRGLNKRTWSNQLDTEIGILKSPSVLMNVFEYFKLQKKQITNNSLDELRFKSWRENLNIDLEDSTSILNITYKDNHKDVILPVLRKISSTYQEYSGKKRLRGIELGVDYFTDQITKYKNRSIASTREAQQFAMDQDLSILSGESDNDIDIKNFLNVEEIRVTAANEIRAIDQQLNQIDNLDTESASKGHYVYEELMYISSQIYPNNEFK